MTRANQYARRRLINRHLWLPNKIANRTISAQSLASGLSKALVWFHRLEKITALIDFSR